MSEREAVEYKVVLVFPGFGEERDNAEQIIEEALGYLNTQKDEPGMRFAQHVSARLEVVLEAEQAQAMLGTEDEPATMILHGLAEDEQAALHEECVGRDVPVCLTVEGEGTSRKRPRSSRTGKRIWKVVFRKRTDDELSAHKVLESVLTAPLDGDPEEVADRVGQIIAVLALGVMQYHFTRNPPKYSM